MKSKSSNRESRRKLLKKLATSSAAAGVVAIPGSWTQPTIKSLVLPAHAATSAVTTTGSASSTALPDQVNIDIDIGIANSNMSITKVTLDLDITHTFNGDLNITLTSPANNTQMMLNDVCGTSDDFNITLDDDAAIMIPNNTSSGDPGCPGPGNPVVGTFNTGGGLNAFIGEDPNGTWVLNIVDDAGADFGTLNSAVLTVTAI